MNVTPLILYIGDNDHYTKALAVPTSPANFIFKFKLFICNSTFILRSDKISHNTISHSEWCWLANKFTHNLQGSSSGTGEIIQLSQRPWSNPEEYGSIGHINPLRTDALTQQHKAQQKRAYFMVSTAYGCHNTVSVQEINGLTPRPHIPYIDNNLRCQAKINGHLQGSLTDIKLATMTPSEANDIHIWTKELLKNLNNLTHWGPDKMGIVLQMTFSNPFFLMKMYIFQLRFHGSLFPRVQLTIFHYWFR